MSPITQMAGLISFLVANDGIALRDAALATHRSEQQLINELRSIMMCGVPPYSPSDYIHVSISGDGPRARVHVRFADHFARPLNFTPREVVALKFALEHYSQGAPAGDRRELKSLQNALSEALHGRAQEAIAASGKGFVTPRQTARQRELIGLLSQAAEEQQLVEIEYYSAHRASLDKRTVHPFALIEIGPYFYLYGYCGLAHDTRHFRIDRVRSASLVDAFFDEKPPRRRNPGRMQALFDGRPKDTLVLRLDKQAAREVLDEWADSPGVTVHQFANGSAIFRMPLYNQFWAIGFIISLGSQAELIEPAWLRAELKKTLKRTLKAHRR